VRRGPGSSDQIPSSEVCRCGSVVEHFLGKEGVMGSIPIIGLERRWVNQTALRDPQGPSLDQTLPDA
jgi:hypothetical protein